MVCCRKANLSDWEKRATTLNLIHFYWSNQYTIITKMRSHLLISFILSPTLLSSKFFQCVKTCKGYMETAALCKYLWCNISMWIDFPPNPSIITGISWKPTSRWWLRALGSTDRSGVSPSHSKYLFFFDWGQPSCEGISCVSPSVFIHGWLQSPFWPIVSVTWLLDPKMPKQKNVM